MIPDINSPLVQPSAENTHPANIEKLYEIYGKEKVDEAVKYLTYKTTPPPLRKEEILGKPLLYVFRHGQSADNIDMIFSGWRDPDLTEKGKQDALSLAELLKDKKIDLLISSDQKRTYETMRLAISYNEEAKKLDVVKDSRLRERNYGDWQGYSKLEKHLEDEQALLDVRRGWSTPPPNGESMATVNERVTELIKELIPLMKENNINIAIACSGNSIRPIRRIFENLTEEEASKVETPTGKDYAVYAIN